MPLGVVMLTLLTDCTKETSIVPCAPEVVKTQEPVGIVTDGALLINPIHVPLCLLVLDHVPCIVPPLVPTVPS